MILHAGGIFFGQKLYVYVQFIMYKISTITYYLYRLKHAFIILKHIPYVLMLSETNREAIHTYYVYCIWYIYRSRIAICIHYTYILHMIIGPAQNSRPLRNRRTLTPRKCCQYCCYGNNIIAKG